MSLSLAMDCYPCTDPGALWNRNGTGVPSGLRNLRVAIYLT